jgi:hypothetical protein
LRVLLALAASVALTAAGSLTVTADITYTEVTLSCNDGHSVVAVLDPIGLANLTAAVQAISSNPTGLSCTLDTAATDPSTATAEWTVYDYNSSGRAIAPRNSPSSMPATTTGNTTSFQFQAGTYTALLTTRDSTLTGNLSNKTLTDVVSVNGSSQSFQYRDSATCGAPPATVRFYFTAPSASGSSYPPPGPPINGTPPAGFYTQFWWSNPVHVALVFGSQQPMPMSAVMADPNEWSDWDGQKANSSPAVTEAFFQAIQHVQAVGLSFGGGCFFENGVTTDANPETFSSAFNE